MGEHALDLDALLWPAGWLVAVVVLFAAGLRLPLELRLSGLRAWLYAASCVGAGLGVWVLANVALVLNDTHIDLTREKVYTPSADAMAVVEPGTTFPYYSGFITRADILQAYERALAGTV